MADCFISYKREDRFHCERVDQMLTAIGYSTWWDNQLHPRDSWSSLIEQEITAAKAVIVLWTPLARSSRWVNKEARFADGERKLVPMRMEDCEPPFEFSDVQTANLVEWDGSHEYSEWLKVLRWIEALAGAPTAPKADPPDAKNAQKTSDYISLERFKTTETSGTTKSFGQDFSLSGQPTPNGSQGDVLSRSAEQDWSKTPRNAPCPCGSGKKYKHCHGAKAHEAPE